jgi:hypothetical protein
MTSPYVVGTLRKRLGLRREPLPRHEYIRQQRERERADQAARALHERIKARRLGLLDELHALSRLELQAHDAGPEHPATWDALAMVCAARPGVLAELAILENVGAADLLRILSASPEALRWAIDTVILRGGVHDSAGRFVEVAN